MPEMMILIQFFGGVLFTAIALGILGGILFFAYMIYLMVSRP